ncbi:hypothetical protein BJY21_002474 [Kineosphaera limosa]|nr:hypothetical protein [Kineosphaera limosa]NYE01290.1 hypothetical protein [Kineosphaera limosa]
MDATSFERAQAQARRTLLASGASELPRMPWSAPVPEDVTSARFALWRANASPGTAPIEEIRAGLCLLDAARSDLETLETALLFVARTEGMTWPQIADELRVRSPQAAQQRLRRAEARTGSADSVAADDTAADDIAAGAGTAGQWAALSDTQDRAPGRSA